MRREGGKSPTNEPIHKLSRFSRCIRIIGMLCAVGRPLIASTDVCFDTSEIRKHREGVSGLPRAILLGVIWEK